MKSFIAHFRPVCILLSKTYQHIIMLELDNLVGMAGEQRYLVILGKSHSDIKRWWMRTQSCCTSFWTEIQLDPKMFNVYWVIRVMKTLHVSLSLAFYLILLPRSLPRAQPPPPIRLPSQLQHNNGQMLPEDQKQGESQLMFLLLCLHLSILSRYLWRK